MYKLRDKKNQLTAYAYACGYVTNFDTPNGSITLSKEHNVYHVKGFDPDHIWECFDTLAEARKFCFNRMKG